MNVELQNRLSKALHRATTVAEAEGAHRFSESFEVFLAGLTVAEAKEIAADSGIRFKSSAKRSEVLQAVREIVGAA